MASSDGNSHPNSTQAASIRILCLHNVNSCASDLHSQFQALDKRLYEKHGIELIYVNAPLQCDSDKDFRMWWEQQGDRCVGLDASLLHLRQIWQSIPFCGILAVGQGAAVASLLPLMQVYEGLKFAIFVQGEALLEEDEHLVENFPILHIIHSPNDDTERLIRQFGGQVHNGSTELTNSDLNVIGKFVVDQKKRLKQEAGGTLVTKDQLYRVEQEVTRLLAEEIAENPPKALMAVISRQGVGGWSGNKRRGPDVEGGGAPCPTEFLLKRESRSCARDGEPGRQHPESQEAQDHR